MGGFEFEDAGAPLGNVNVVTLDELRAMDPALSKKADASGQGKPAEDSGKSRPRFYDAKFRKMHKDGSFDEIAAPDPAIESPLADSHTHLGSLRTSDLPLARAAAYGVEFICNITDITEDAGDVYALLDGWKEGAADEESFGQLAMDNSVDGSASYGGLYTDVYKGQMVKNFEDWCFAEGRKHGDSGLVRTEFGYHIMFYVGGEEGWLRYGKTALINDLYAKFIETVMETYPIKVNYRAIRLGSSNMLASN